jgi:hypothetical protein
MSDGRGAVRTTDGEASIGDRYVRIRRTPLAFLRARLSTLRDGSLRKRVGAAVGVALFLSAPVVVVQQIRTLSGTPAWLALLLVVGILAFQLVPFWLRYFRETTIPASSVADVTLRADERTLRVVYDDDSRLAVLGGGSGQQWFGDSDPLGVFEAGETETTLTLRTDDEVRKARRLLRATGLAGAVGGLAPEQTETHYRVDTANGAAFCERCGSQVSPSDGICPACEYALRIERPAGSDRETHPTDD